MVNSEAVAAVKSRIEATLESRAPGFDPLLISGLFEFLMSFLSSCGGDTPTPEEAVAQVKKMSPWKEAYVKGCAVAYLREKGIKNARRHAPIAVDVVAEVAKKCSESEQLAVAAMITGFDDPKFDPAFDVF